jgi:peptidoglycan hydrolase CwlO-like protein
LRREEVGRLEGEKLSLLRQVSDFNASCQDIEKQAFTVRDKLERLQREKTALEGEVASARATIAQQEEGMDSLRAAEARLGAEVGRLTTTLGEARKKGEEAAVRLAQAERRIASLEGERQSLAARVRDAEGQAERLAARVREAEERLLASEQRAEALTADHEAVVGREQTRAGEAEALSRSLKQQLEGIEADSARRARATRQLEADVATLRDECHRLEGQLKERHACLRKSADDAEAAGVETERLAQELKAALLLRDALQSRLLEGEARLKESDGVIAQLREDLEAEASRSVLLREGRPPGGAGIAEAARPGPASGSEGEEGRRKRSSAGSARSSRRRGPWRAGFGRRC